jgi:hypothetical protein
MGLLFGLEIKETPTGKVSKNRLKNRAMLLNRQLHNHKV